MASVKVGLGDAAASVTTMTIDYFSSLVHTDRESTVIWKRVRYTTWKHFDLSYLIVENLAHGYHADYVARMLYQNWYGVSNLVKGGVMTLSLKLELHSGRESLPLVDHFTPSLFPTTSKDDDSLSCRM